MFANRLKTGRVVDGIGAVIFKSLYKNKRENNWVPGWVEEIMACPGVFGTKTTQKSTFFKMGVSLGRPHWKKDIIRKSNRWRRTGNNGYYITKIPTRVLATFLLHLTDNR